MEVHLAGQVLTLEVRAQGIWLMVGILAAAFVIGLAVLSFQAHRAELRCTANECQVIRSAYLGTKVESIPRASIRGLRVEESGTGKRHRARLVVDTAGEPVEVSPWQRVGKDVNESLARAAAEADAFVSSGQTGTGTTLALRHPLLWSVVVIPLALALAILVIPRGERAVLDKGAGTVCRYRGSKQEQCRPLAEVARVEVEPGRAPAVVAVLVSGERLELVKLGGSRWDPRGAKANAAADAVARVQEFLAR